MSGRRNLSIDINSQKLDPLANPPKTDTMRKIVQVSAAPSKETLRTSPDAKEAGTTDSNNQEAPTARYTKREAIGIDRSKYGVVEGLQQIKRK